MASSIFKAWDHTLNLKDVFHDESRTFEERRDEIVKRIRAAAWFPKDQSAAGDHPDAYIVDLVEGIEDSEDTDEFNFMWSEFYNWCDDGKRVWIETQ